MDRTLHITRGWELDPKRIQVSTSLLVDLICPPLNRHSTSTLCIVYQLCKYNVVSAGPLLEADSLGALHADVHRKAKVELACDWLTNLSSVHNKHD